MKALRIRHINGMEVRKKRPRGFKKEAQGVQVSPLNPLSVAPCPEQGEGTRLVDYVHRVPVGVLLRLQVQVATAAISPASFIIDACQKQACLDGGKKQKRSHRTLVSRNTLIMRTLQKISKIRSDWISETSLPPSSPVPPPSAAGSIDTSP